MLSPQTPTAIASIIRATQNDRFREERDLLLIFTICNAIDTDERLANKLELRRDSKESYSHGMHANTEPNDSTAKKHSQILKTAAPTGWILVLAAMALLFFAAFFGLQQRFWVLSPAEKLEFAWAEDLKLLQNSRHAPLLQKIREVKMRATAHSPAQDWLPKLKPAIVAKKDGELILDVFLIHQIEGYRYGVIMQYALLDAKTGNMVDEFARTLWLGIYY